MKNVTWLALVICIACGKQESEDVKIQKTSLETMITNPQNVDTLWVNKVSSDVQWIGRKVTGEHNGHIQLAGGFIVKNNGNLQSGEILMNMQSITVDDIENPEWTQKLVDHPTAKFVFSKFEGRATDTHVTGDMTIRNKTVPMDFIFNTVVDLDSSYATGSINIDRSLFGIKYGSGSFFEGLGDKMIMDDFTLNFKLIAR
jgi:polyisoprenoid-binding protein YceI